MKKITLIASFIVLAFSVSKAQLVTTLAGSTTAGSANGTGTAASFSLPIGVATDGTNIYVADAANNRIRQINISSGVVTTLAGSGSPGNANGTGVGASFNSPFGIVYDPAATALYVADYNNNQIRRVSVSTGVVGTLSGSGSQGFADGPATSATFHNPTALTIDGAGNLYVADVGNNEIRQVVISNGAVTTIAGSTTSGSADGTGAAAQFSSPSGIVFANGNLYVADMSNNEIRQVVPSTGVTTTVAGAITAGSADGFGTNSAFFQPYGIAYDGNGNLYVTDMGNNSIRKIFLTTMDVYTYTGGGSSGSTNGSTLNAKFYAPHGLVTDATGDVFIADANNNEVREIGICATAISATISGSGATTVCYGLNDTVIGIENGSTNAPFTFYWNGTAATDTVVANLPTSTTYSLVVVDGIGCHSDTVTTTVTVDNPGTFSITNDGPAICQGSGGSSFLQAAGGNANQFTWTPSNSISSGSPTLNNVNANPTITTTYTVTGTDPGGCVTPAVTITVPVFALPAVSMVGNVLSGLNICSGNADTLRAVVIGNGPFMYNWSNDGTTDTVIAYSSSEYNVNVTDVNGCQSNADSVIGSKKTPSLLVNGNTVICSGSTANLQVSGAESYSWAPNGDFGNPTDSVQNVSPGGLITYTVTGNTGGCKTTQLVTVNVASIPPVTISGPNTTCAGTSITLFGTGADVYSWAGGPNAAGYQVVPVNNSTYTVTGTDLSTGCSNTATTTITVNPLPVISITGSSSVCQGSGTTLTANGADSYQWSGGPNTQTYNVSPQNTTTFEVMGTSTVTGCSDTATQVVVVNMLPSVTINGNNSVCSGSSITLTANGADTYQWSGGPATSVYTFTPGVNATYTVTGTNTTTTCSNSATLSVSVNTPSAITANAYPSTIVCQGGQITLFGGGGSTYSWSSGVSDGVSFRPASSATFTVTSISNGCLVSSTVSITVNPLPVITITATPKDSICQGGNVTLTASGATSYSWSNGITNAVAFSPATSNVYQVTGTDANGCSNSSQVPIVVNNLPAITGAVSPQTVCKGGSVTLNGYGGTTYTWSGGVTNGVSFVPATSGTYTLTGTNAAGCSNTAVVGVTINPVPVISDSAIPSASVCQGNSVALLGKGASSYSWSGGISDGISFVPVASGTYTVTGFGANGCSSKDSITIKVNNKVILSPLAINTTCALNNGSIKVTASSGTPPYVYSWSTVPVNTTDSIGSLSPGTYIITVNDVNKCSSYSSIDISSSTAPILSISTSSSSCGNASGSAAVGVVGGTAPYRYAWSNGDTTNTANGLTLGTYIVTVTDENHCSSFASADISNLNGPSITANAVTNVACNSLATGAINIGVSGGALPYSFVWSNGATTQNISGLAAGPYQVTVTDGNNCSALGNFSISQPSALKLTKSIVKANCGVSDGGATVKVSGGVQPYSYLWNNGRTSDSIATVNAGAYYVTVIDHNGCEIDSAQVSVSNINGPVVSIGISGSASCGSGGVTLTANVTGGTSPYAYLWSTSSTKNSISQIPAGNYNIVVTDKLSCIGAADTSVYEVPPPVAPICMVTVDSATNKNMIIWDKITTKNIAYYNIYKESTQAGVYLKIAKRPYDSNSVYIDTLSNPQVRSWRYELSEVDSCGNESALSPDHKTMHLTVNQGLSNTVNLIWDNYEGLNFSTYYVYRDTMPTGLTRIDSIPNNIFTYTDAHPPKAAHLYYRMEVVNPNPCNPHTDKPMSINYNASKSNTGNFTFTNTGIASAGSTPDQLSIFPNPSTGVFTLSLNTANGSKHLTVSVVNTLGQVVSMDHYTQIPAAYTKQLDLSALAKGVYFIKMSTDNTTLYNKVVIQ